MASPVPLPPAIDCGTMIPVRLHLVWAMTLALAACNSDGDARDLFIGDMSTSSVPPFDAEPDLVAVPDLVKMDGFPNDEGEDGDASLCPTNIHIGDACATNELVCRDVRG